METSGVSIRVASWIAAQAVRTYCAAHSLTDNRIEEFCRFLESVVSAGNLPEWDTSGNSLAITGLGDPLPKDLDVPNQFEQLIQAAREITASQLYGNWNPNEVDNFLKECIRISGIRLDTDIALGALAQHDPGTDGWGEPYLIENAKARRHQS